MNSKKETGVRNDKDKLYSRFRNYDDRIRSGLYSKSSLKKGVRYWPKPKKSTNYNESRGLSDYHVIDLECYRAKEEEHVPYAVGFTTRSKRTLSTIAKELRVSDGLEVSEDVYYKYAIKPSEVDPYKWLGEILKRCIVLKKHSGLKWYSHNGGGYDHIIMVKALLKAGYPHDRFEMLPIENNLVVIRIYLMDPVEYPERWIEFRDSLPLMGGESLSDLIKGLEVDKKYGISKLDFDHSVVNADNYELYATNLTGYLKNDVLGLYWLLHEFRREIDDNFKIDCLKVVTTSSLAKTIFELKFMKKDELVCIKNANWDEWIRKSYKGGRCEVFKPFGQYIYGYDIVSMYPYCMKMPMPIGKPDIYNVDGGLDGFFGFAEAEVETPKNSRTSKIPFLGIHHEGKLIFPSGKYKGVFFSEELKYAITIGYKVKLLSIAISFQKGNPFDEYVDTFFEMKKTCTGAMRKISKLLLNGLYGRTGMKPKFNHCEILNAEGTLNIENNFEAIVRDISLGDDKKLNFVTYNKIPTNTKSKDYNFNVSEYVKTLEMNVASTPIASSIAAYARIELDKYLRLKGNNVYYVDTDSVYLNKPLPKYMLGDELGKMQNILSKNVGYSIDKDSDYCYKEILFLQPKVKMGYVEFGSREYHLTFKGYSHINKYYDNDLTHADIWRILKEAYLSIHIDSKNEDVLWRYNRNRIKKEWSGFYLKSVVETITLSTIFDKRHRLFGDLVMRAPDGSKIIHKDVWIDTDPLELSYYDGSIIKSNNLAIYPWIERIVPTPALKYPNNYMDNWDIKSVEFDRQCLDVNIKNIYELLKDNSFAMLKLGWVNNDTGSIDNNQIGYSITSIMTSKDDIINKFTDWWNNESSKFVWERGEKKML